MRISRSQIQENRERVLSAASALFRASGFDGVAIADIMRQAGLTHGGFYNHFASKDDLAVEAVAAAWSAMADHRAGVEDLTELLSAYLSQAARGNPDKSCPAAALAGDVRRQPTAVRQAFATGLDEMIDSTAAQLTGEPAEQRKRAVCLVTRMVGALMLSRAAPDDHPLSTELLAANLEAALQEISHE